MIDTLGIAGMDDKFKGPVLNAESLTRNRRFLAEDKMNDVSDKFPRVLAPIFILAL